MHTRAHVDIPVVLTSATKFTTESLASDSDESVLSIAYLGGTRFALEMGVVT